jgi:uncharacterized membrane protein YccC
MKLDKKTIFKIRLESGRNKPAKAENNLFLAQAALDSLSEADINQALAEAAREKLPGEEIEKVLPETAAEPDPAKEQIDKTLSRLAEEALRAIAEKDYHGPLRLQAKEFIDVGLAVYGYGDHVKTAFGPFNPKGAE